MSSPRQVIVSTLKDLSHQCLREQMHLKLIGHSRREIEDEEKRTRERIRQIKLRVNREILTHGSLLGIDMSVLDDNEGEGWKEKV